MKQFMHSVFSLARRLALSAFIVTAVPVYANDHGGGGAPAGGEALQFTVNLGDHGAMGRVLQVMMAFEYATPEVAQRLAALKPKVQHRIIMLLASQEVAGLQTSKGKVELQELIVKDLNQLIDEKPKHGVKEVLFTSFIIQ